MYGINTKYVVYPKKKKTFWVKEWRGSEGWFTQFSLFVQLPGTPLFLLRMDTNNRSFEETESSMLDFKFFFRTLLDWLSAMSNLSLFSIIDLLDLCNFCN